MSRAAAFLRAINVGGHVVKMKELASLFREAGLVNVSTFIASGNVIFESTGADMRDLERKIEERLFSALGYEVVTFIRSEAEIAEIARRRPFPEPDLSAAPTLVVGFLKAPPPEASRKLLLQLTSDIDAFAVVGREIFWLSRKRQSESKFSGAVFEKKLGMKVTFRGFPTVVNLTRRLQAPR